MKLETGQDISELSDEFGAYLGGIETADGRDNAWVGGKVWSLPRRD